MISFEAAKKIKCMQEISLQKVEYQKLNFCKSFHLKVVIKCGIIEIIDMNYGYKW